MERYATGAAYESVFEAAQTNRLAGRALRLPEDSVSEHRAEVVSIEGDTATVRDCSIDDLLVLAGWRLRVRGVGWMVAR